MNRNVILACLATLLVAPVAPAQELADLVLRGGKIVTVDDALGTVSALAARDGRIVAVGADEVIAAHIGPDTRVIDLDGRLAIPGFIEGHGHFTGLGQAKMILDLTTAASWAAIVEQVAAAAAIAEPGDWIVGRGWHQEKWDEPVVDAVEGFPRHDGLSGATPDNPVLLTHASGHACIANKKAMDVAGVSGATADPPGGEILRDESGTPIGVFRETAQGLIAAARRPAGTARRQRYAELNRAVDLAVAECHRKGVTSFQDAGSDLAEIDTLARRARSGDLGVRLWIMVRVPTETLRANPDVFRHRRVNDVLTVGGIKRSIDGALGARGAWLLEPYSDSPGSTGLATATIEDVEALADIALDHGVQLCVHAIGDRANREVLDLYERKCAGIEKGRSLRWRIEHAQHLHPDDIGRFAQLGVIAAMQGVHCTSDGPWVIARLGEQRAREGAYVWRSLIDSGAVVTNGTDAPVEDVDPIASFHASVTRVMRDGRSFYPGQRMTRMEALKSYTIDCAYAAFEEDVKGSLTPGKLADIVVLDTDILTEPDDDVRDARVVITIVGGCVVYQKGV